MSNIPADIMEAARKTAAGFATAGHLLEPLVISIAKAILTERERCALIAEGNAKGFDFQSALADGDDMQVGAKSVQLAIAATIRGEA